MPLLFLFGSIFRLFIKIPHFCDNSVTFRTNLFDMLYSSVAEAEIGLQLLLQKQSEAPEHMDPVDISEIPLESGFPAAGCVNLCATVDDVVYANIYVENHLDDRGIAEFRYVRDDQSNALSTVESNMKVPTDALSQADVNPYIRNLLEKLPFEGFS